MKVTRENLKKVDRDLSRLVNKAITANQHDIMKALLDAEGTIWKAIESFNSIDKK
jgi:hypothetical protein